MATSGRVDSNAYEGRYISFIWSIKSQNNQANTTTISWRLEGDGTGQSSRYKAGNFKVVIDGVTVYSTPQDSRIWLYDGTVVTSGNYTFTHDMLGNKSFNVSIQAGIYTYAVNCKGSAGFSLPNIPRASVITSVVGDTVNTPIKVNYTAYVSAYINNLTIRLNGAVLQTISSYKSGDSFTLTPYALEAIYNATQSAASIGLQFVLQSFDNNTLIGTSSVTKVLDISNSSPILEGLEYQDTNNTTIALTQDNKLIIRNKSELQLTANGLTARNGATLSTITVTGGGVDTTRAISGTSISSEVFNFGAINQSADFTLTVVITDSRGFTASRTIEVLVVDYVEPTAQISATRVDNYYTTTNVTVNATYSAVNGRNSITITAAYKKVSDASYSTPITLTNGVTEQIALDNNYEWNLKVTVADALSSITYNLVIGRGLPIWFIDRVLNSIGINCFPAENNSLEVNGLRLDDKIYIGSQELYDKVDIAVAGDAILACAYEYKLIESIFNGVNIPAGYERAYKLTFQYSTANSNIIVVSLNNISSNNCNTWSNDTYRLIGGTRMFKESELTLENVNGTTRQGLNLKVSNSAAYGAKIWGITLHGYLVREDTNLNQSTYNLDDVTPVNNITP